MFYRVRCWDGHMVLECYRALGDGDGEEGDDSGKDDGGGAKPVLVLALPTPTTPPTCPEPTSPAPAAFFALIAKRGGIPVLLRLETKALPLLASFLPPASSPWNCDAPLLAAFVVACA